MMGQLRFLRFSAKGINKIRNRPIKSNYPDFVWFKEKNQIRSDNGPKSNTLTWNTSSVICKTTPNYSINNTDKFYCSYVKLIACWRIVYVFLCGWPWFISPIVETLHLHQAQVNIEAMAKSEEQSAFLAPYSLFSYWSFKRSTFRSAMRFCKW